MNIPINIILNITIFLMQIKNYNNYLLIQIF